jgi:quercetin dioxygenase-like cupin family protein
MGATATAFLATGVHTGGIFGLVDEQAIQGEAIPLHRHDHDWEAFYIIDGDLHFYLDDQPAQSARLGAFVYIPPGTIHGFRVASEQARYLILTTPRHAEFYRAISLPEPQAVITETMIDQACAAYGVVFVAPLPE